MLDTLLLPSNPSPVPPNFDGEGGGSGEGRKRTADIIKIFVLKNKIKQSLPLFLFFLKSFFVCFGGN